MIEKLKMVPGLDADTIDERVRYASRFGEICKRVLAYYLCELESTKRYIDLGDIPFSGPLSGPIPVRWASRKPSSEICSSLAGY